jgi:hypothetical protein
MQPDCPSCDAAIPIGRTTCAACDAEHLRYQAPTVQAGRIVEPPSRIRRALVLAYGAWVLWATATERWRPRAQNAGAEAARRALRLRIDAALLLAEHWALLVEAEDLAGPDTQGWYETAEQAARDHYDTLRAEYAERYPGRGYPVWIRRNAERFNIALPVRDR